MSFINLDSIVYGDSPNLDAFTRLRVSSPTTLFESRSQYNTSPRDWSTQVTGTGAVSLLTNEGTVQLSTGGTANGAKAVRQTRLCWHFDNGKSQLIFMSFRFGAPASNLRRRIGYFDTTGGLFLEQTDSFFGFVLRSSVSGVPVDTPLPQSSWNVDKLDGTGPSGITLDITKIQFMFIDLSGLGSGRIRVGFFYHGQYVVALVLDNSNASSTTATNSVKFPFRAEIENTGVTSDTNTLNMIVSVVASEGGDEFFGVGKLNSASNGISTVAATSRRPILSIRPALTFGGLPNRAWYILIEAAMRVTTNDIYWEIVYGGTLTAPSWVSAGADSSVEYDVSASAITGGVSVLRGFGISGQGSSSGQSIASIVGRFPNSVDSLLNTQNGHSLVVTPFTGTANVAAVFNWREIQ